MSSRRLSRPSTAHRRPRTRSRWDIKRLTGGRGVDVAIEALGKPETFQLCLDATRPGGIVSSLGIYGGKLEIPVEPFVYGSVTSGS